VLNLRFLINNNSTKKEILGIKMKKVLSVLIFFSFNLTLSSGNLFSQILKENDQKIIIEKPTDPILELERISKEIKFREKIDVHSIEEGYGERWKKRKHTI